MPLPHILYLCLSDMGFVLPWAVQLSGHPMRRSHSFGLSFRVPCGGVIIFDSGCVIPLLSLAMSVPASSGDCITIGGLLYAVSVWHGAPGCGFALLSGFVMWVRS